jgi:hypothetical protein
MIDNEWTTRASFQAEARRCLVQAHREMLIAQGQMELPILGKEHV